MATINDDSVGGGKLIAVWVWGFQFPLYILFKKVRDLYTAERQPRTHSREGDVGRKN